MPEDLQDLAWVAQIAPGDSNVGFGPIPNNTSRKEKDMAQKKKASTSTPSSTLDLSSLSHTVLRAEKDRRIALQFQIEQIPDDALNAEIQRRHDKMIENLKNQTEVL